MLYKSMHDTIICGNCLDMLPTLPDNSIAACITSPPYADQRNGLYVGIPDKDYPDWTVSWMKALRPKLLREGSALIVIRPHIRGGQISDYVLKTRLALRADGWKECEELIWYKPDAPPLGSVHRPRRCWESILWFSQTGSPFIDLRACGNTKSTRTGGFAGSNRFGDGVVVAKNQVRELKEGTSRMTDVLTAYVGSLPEGVMHPAMYPTDLTDVLVQSFTKKGDVVLDPFSGSGQTLLSAIRFGRKFLGIEREQKYVDEANSRILSEKSARQPELPDLQYAHGERANDPCLTPQAEADHGKEGGVGEDVERNG